MKLSPAQVAMLRAIRDHGSPTHGLHSRSAHGGASATLGSLQRLGLVLLGWGLTVAGAEALAARERSRAPS